MENLKMIDTTGNPAPLGLFAFALTTILLNIHNAGFFPLSGMIVGMGIFYGGIAQIIAGIMEWKKGNSFGTIAFISFGSFWISLTFIWMAPRLGIADAADATSMGYYLLIWGILAFTLFIGTLRGNTAGKLVFGTVTVLFLLLALHNFTGSALIGTIAGYEGILCGFLAFYEGAAIILNEKYGKSVLPL